MGPGFWTLHAGFVLLTRRDPVDPSTIDASGLFVRSGCALPEFANAKNRADSVGGRVCGMSCLQLRIPRCRVGDGVSNVTKPGTKRS